jgi:steroid 5-alpha reductase family enzyme
MGKIIGHGFYTASFITYKYDPVSPEITIAIFIFGYMSTLFILAQLLRDNSIADIAWGPGFALIAGLIALRYPYPGASWAALLLGLWGGRLGLYLLLRKLREKKEDWRYANWRKTWGTSFLWRSYLQVFILQGIFMWIIALPLMLHPERLHLNVQTLAGGLLFGVGLLWESVADYQLMRFKQQPGNAGKFLQSGLWALSRHPNYFGEIVLWWGIWIVLADKSTAIITLLSPLCISWLLMRVSGVPMLEEKFRQKPGFREYAQHTPALFPKFKKRPEKG